MYKKGNKKMKTCRTCDEEKSFSEYYKASSCKDGYRGSCRQCNMKQRRERLAKADPDQRRSVVLKGKYGITLDTKRDMQKAQNDKCKICGTTDYGKKGLLVVDHCHSTGKVRGLLCYSCNIALGMFKDNVETIKAAIKYLEE